MASRSIFPPLLKNIPFRRFWIGKTISLFGDQITGLALPLTAVLILHANAGAMGLLTAAGWLPYLLFGIHAGAWVDSRGHRRRIMMVADVARALLILSIPVLYFLGYLSMTELLIVAFIVGVFNVLFNVSASTLFVALVPQEKYVEANSLLNGSRAISFTAGPSLSGFLVQLLSAPVALLADALSFIASAFFLARTKAVEPPPAKPEPGHISAGLRYIGTSRFLRFSLASVATINFFNYIFAALVVLYVTRILHISPGLLGLIMGFGALGSVIGSLITGKISRRIGLGRTLLLGTILFPAPLILIPVAGGSHLLVITLLFLAEFLSGLGVMILDISYGTAQTAAIPDVIRARVSGAWGFVNNGIRPIGALVGGALPALLGIHGTLWIATVGSCLGFLWLLPIRILKYHDVKDFVPEQTESMPMTH